VTGALVGCPDPLAPYICLDQVGNLALAAALQFRGRVTLERVRWPPGTVGKRRTTKSAQTDPMATSRTAKKPPMQSFARLIATPGRHRETVFDLPSRAMRVGDPLTSSAGRVELGVALRPAIAGLRALQT
jgi:hypothetical protein